MKTNKLILICYLIALILIIVILFLYYGSNIFFPKSVRSDSATKLTNCFPNSCQNPVFSPDGKYILFTRFINGYNKGPSELVRIDLTTKEKKIIISDSGFDNVNVPFGSWIDDKITWASDRNGTSDEIYTANSDGTNIKQVTTHSVQDGYYIEPVFNPSNTNQIIFEVVLAENEPHKIALVEQDKENKISLLTNNDYDYRLPSWSKNGKKIVFQRADKGQDNWQIYTADINISNSPGLQNISKISVTNSHDTDLSWAAEDKYILSSSDYGNLKVPNIYAFPINTSLKPIRITHSDSNEDGAPTFSPNNKFIAFESHSGQDENSPSEIWIISADKLNSPINSSISTSTIPQEKLAQVKTYANTYIEYSKEDIEKLKKFDIVMVEPYNLTAKQVAELKGTGTIIIAYISVGEADDERRYWETWKPTDIAYQIDSIPRTKTDQNDNMFIGEDPGWPGSYFVDASNQKWQNIILNEELPYILALGDSKYDGIVMDLIDVVDEYEGKPKEEEMRQGMVDLIRQIKQKYPDLIVIPNRGFGIINEMSPYIDAFKFEELSLKYNNIKGEKNYGLYTSQIDQNGRHENQEQIDMAINFAKKNNHPLFILDHVQTEPLDTINAKKGYDEAQTLSQKYGVKFIWYGDSVDQDLPIWPFYNLK